MQNHITEIDSAAIDSAVPAKSAAKNLKRRWLLAGAAILVVLLLTGLTLFSRNFFFPPSAPKPVVDAPKQLSKPAKTHNFTAQTPKWAECGDGFVCADVLAPLDWQNPAADTITLRLIKHPANSGAAQGTLFINPGGPGASGVEFVRDNLQYMLSAELQKNYDVIGWDPRGVGNSTPIKCLDAKDMDEHLFGTAADLADNAHDPAPGSEKWLKEVKKQNQEFGAACKKHSGAMLEQVDTVSTVHDLNMLREIVGDAQLNYLGFSYGTYIGALYAENFPEQVGRLVLDGAVDPAVSQTEMVMEQVRGFELALRSYVEDCLQRKNCPLSGSTDQAMRQIAKLLKKVDEHPLVGKDGRPFSVQTLIIAIITPLYSQAAWPELDKLFAEIAHDKTETGFQLADSYYRRSNGKYMDNSQEAFAAINCLDYEQKQTLDKQQMRENAKKLAEISPTFGKYQGYSEASCLGWPASSRHPRGPLAVSGTAPILVVGTTGDPATPYHWAQSLAQQLQNSVLLSYEGEGHTAYGYNSCINSAVDAYLLHGTVPAAGTVCSAAND